MSKREDYKKASDLIRLFGIRARKEYGQNFLVDDNVFDKIIEYADITDDDLIIEIGPGIGTMTQRLCEKAGFVVGIEIDKGMKNVLDFVLSKKNDFIIIYDDIKNIDIYKDIISIYKKDSIRQVKIVANLPYYIATAIITDVLAKTKEISKLVLMVQKEVARRICADPGGREYGVLSIAVQLYAKASIVLDVLQDAFMPVPEVDSSVVVLEPDVFRYSPGDEVFFFRVVKAAFSQRRKTIINSIYAGLGKKLDKQELKGILESSGIDPQDRAERIPVSDFCALAKNLYPLF